MKNSAVFIAALSVATLLAFSLVEQVYKKQETPSLIPLLSGLWDDWLDVPSLRLRSLPVQQSSNRKLGAFVFLCKNDDLDDMRKLVFNLDGIARDKVHLTNAFANLCGIDRCYLCIFNTRTCRIFILI